ncbi:type II 3-dehydroquinate dehydratase [Schleiferia thermophila]|jgi:3-dehydroquinate dehydratase-2|uniref:3-dehydroquinate dehydratase n=1 Tax=Schleiferia thermophila TaxID=884107 RepID=A0A369A2A5_9FLAO|nr:type II 3-dehydroquinate dehydratase [Schleiferia thermophila]KFD39168.1 3-dehydroquinate dehydratase [Schleiferia thermophila str. Yellowstone]RCX03339.1 3-dehydroquinate dehydratase [Schleiferia thermophila]GCD80468.1 3-dehydroquinate dehydratase [Schleiferia thermophila]
MKILILNGPNLNLLGKRETSIYGTTTWEGIFQQLQKEFTPYRMQLFSFQTNLEGEIINQLQQADTWADGIVLNAGGYTHTSVAIGDAVKALSTPLVEVHISNLAARESYRHTSYISPYAKGVIFGFGPESYTLALHYFLIKK